MSKKACRRILATAIEKNADLMHIAFDRSSFTHIHTYYSDNANADNAVLVPKQFILRLAKRILKDKKEAGGK